MHTYRGNLMTRLRAFSVLCAVSAVGGCSIESQSPPDLAGPSGFAISLSLTSSPQLLPRDGKSRATVTLNARDEVANTPVAGQTITLTALPSTARLSTHEVRTGSDGRATVIVTAPAADDSSDSAITVVATPVGGVSDSVAPRALTIGLVFDPDLVEASARFTVTPAQPKVGEKVTFDASASSAAEGSVIKLYSWSFGDDTDKVTTTPTADKTYDEARAFSVVLTVTDDQDRKSTVARTITVVP
jgi:PKD repeat protein